MPDDPEWLQIFGAITLSLGAALPCSMVLAFYEVGGFLWAVAYCVFLVYAWKYIDSLMEETP